LLTLTVLAAATFSARDYFASTAAVRQETDNGVNGGVDKAIGVGIRLTFGSRHDPENSSSPSIVYARTSYGPESFHVT
jgi:hypothetical protein